MGIGEFIMAIKTIYEIITVIKAILEELEIDQKDIESAMKNLKEFCEGPLVDAIADVVNDLAESCAKLIKDALDFMDILETDVKDHEKKNKEGAELLKEALYK